MNVSTECGQVHSLHLDRHRKDYATGVTKYCPSAYYGTYGDSLEKLQMQYRRRCHLSTYTVMIHEAIY